MSEYASYEDDGTEFEEAELNVDDREPRKANRDQRRKAAKAQRRAARRELADGSEVVAVEYDDETYWVPADPTDWPIEALLAFEDGKAVTALRALIAADENGRSGFDLLLSKKYRVADLNAIFEKVAKVGGFGDAGN
ncbi:MAG: hypothetical protein WBA98_03725 [Gordonia sp. (in: high G+C Gram-positive bacteria)]|uniref:hypothetical protein n=1 Tax=Gordonia sp. (in: high G+C Gram-positive bacteria) TaxID=84139 RepID=UPI003C7610F5